MSPVAAVIIIVSASVKVNPLVLVKRTWVPLMSGVLVVLALSFFKYMSEVNGAGRKLSALN